MSVVPFTAAEPIRLALPKGRILKDLRPILDAAGIHPEAAFDDSDARQLRFKANVPGLEIVRVRSFDVASFVAFGGADIGVAGRDVVMEFDYPEVYAPLDLGIGKCRLAVAEPKELAPEDDPSRWSHVASQPSTRTSLAVTLQRAVFRRNASSFPGLWNWHQYWGSASVSSTLSQQGPRLRQMVLSRLSISLMCHRS